MSEAGLDPSQPAKDPYNPRINLRQRKWAPKVRTGCATCRSRRIKCDEAKPSCKRCTTSRIVCDFVSRGAKASLAPTLTVSGSPLLAQPTQSEQELIHLFRTKLTLNSADEFNEDLWRVHIPLASQSHEPIWHASIAFAALWRYQMAKSSTDKLFKRQMHEESIRQYSSALNCIIQLTRKPKLSMADKSSILVANVLFLRCCMYRGDAKAGQAIVASSVQLIQHWDMFGSDKSSTPIPSNMIVLFFSKMGRYLYQSLLTTGHSPWQWEKGLTALQDQPIISYTDACLELEMIWTGARAVIEDLPVQPKMKQMERAYGLQVKFRDSLDMWNSKFDALRRLAHTPGTDQIRLTVLLVRKILVSILVNVDIGRLETSWDDYYKDFERATLLAESVLMTGGTDRDKRKTIFTPMLAKSLHFMARVCRHPRLRRQIVKLLAPQLGMVRLLSLEEDYSPTQIQETIIAVEESGKNGTSDVICNEQLKMQIDIAMVSKPAQNDTEGPPEKPHCTVIGAGVIGLSVAYRLLLADYRVTIVARDFPQPFETTDAKTQINYTSLWAGAHNRWVLPTSEHDIDGMRDHAFARSTFSHMSELLSAYGTETGIAFTPGVEYLEDPVPDVYRDLTVYKATEELGMQDFRFLGKGDLPEHVAWGCEYRSWCVNPMVYCMFLLRRICLLGGQVAKMELRALEEVTTLSTLDTSTIINCSGIGFGDPAVFPTRGQTVLVAEDCPATITRQNSNGTWTFCVPRPCSGGTIIGGTKQPDDWSLDADPAVREQLLNAFSKTYTKIFADGKKPHVLRDIVGRRPTRKGGMRLEKQALTTGHRVIHAYGLGGRGYELSWGVAEAVLDLVKS
ncbi:hypothetical protein NLG97_g527 [Lecanicillium saksenae]|uniref:Uncharacterized protein n=1 Tax=Lecanicillium saksenae TaxID=468837 RepID=A0ACC1R690_9HYPO|nr:hypothetical protein NLG97_g527 [Lecanicillium saksenae]